MKHPSNKCRWLRRTAVLGAVLLTLSACGSPGSATSTETQVPASTPIDQGLHDSLPENIKSSNTIRVGVTSTNGPFTTKNGEELVGIIPEIAHEVGAVLGVKIQWIESPFPGLIPALQANKSDIIWTAIKATEERKKVLDFVDYMNVSFSFLVMSGNPVGINGIEDLCGVRVGSARGTVPEVLLKEQSAKCAAAGKPEVSISLFDDQVTSQTQVRAGKLDAHFGTTASMRYVAENFDGGKAFEVVPRSYPDGAIGLATSKEQPQLTLAMQAALKKVIESGSYDRILEKYKAADESLSASEISSTVSTLK